jgi:GNAT superfamily N-acetyltransferase
MKKHPFHIETNREPEAKDLEAVQTGLRTYNRSQVPLVGYSEFAVFARDPDGRIVGGVVAETGHGWLHISTAWVDEQERGMGLGSQLLAAAEQEGRRQGCHSVYLDTFSFQARPFYERLGYEVFGVLENFPDGHQRYFLRKVLASG